MIKEVFLTFSAKIYLAITGFLIAVITARILGPEGRGIYSFLDNLIFFSILAGNFGLGIANVYLVKKKKYSPSVLFWNSIFFGLALGILVIGGIQAIKSVSSNFFQQIPPMFIWIVSLSLPFHIAANIIWYLLLGLERIFAYNLVQMIVRTCFLALIVILLLIVPSIKTAVFLLAFSGILWLIVFVPTFHKNIFSKPKINLPALKDSIQFGFISQLGVASQFLIPRFGIFAINFFLNPAAVGLYSIALVASETLNYSSYSLSTVLLPKISGAKTFDLDPERLAQKSCRLNLFFVILVGIPLIVLSPFFMKMFFGEEFLLSVESFRVLVLGSIFGCWSWVLGSYILGRGFPRYFMAVFLVPFIFVVVLNFVFVPILGILGSAVAVSTSGFLSSAISIYFYKKISSQPFNFRNFLIPTTQDFKELHASFSALLSSLKIKLWRRKF